LKKKFAVAYTRNEEQEFFTSFVSKWDKLLDELEDYSKLGVFFENIGTRRLDNLLKSARAEKLGLLVLSSMDDLSPLENEAMLELKLLRGYGCTVYIEEYDLILNSEADFEPISPVNKKKEAAKGRYGVQSPKKFDEMVVAYGYDLIDGVPVVNENEAKIIRIIYDMYLQGKGAQKIADELTEKQYPTKMKLGRWHSKTVSNILTNEKYINEIGVGGEYDPIISGSVFYEAKRIRNRRSEKIFKTSKKEENIFLGKIICAECGGTYRRISKLSPYTKIPKYTWKCGKKFQLGINVCTNNNINEKYLISLLKDAFHEYATIRLNRISDEAAYQRLVAKTKALEELDRMRKTGYLTEEQRNSRAKELEFEIDKNKQLVKQLPYKVFGILPEDKSTDDIHRMVDFLYTITIQKNWVISFVFDGGIEVKRRFTNNMRLRQEGEKCQK